MKNNSIQNSSNDINVSVSSVLRSGLTLKLLACISMLIDHIASTGLLKMICPDGLFGMNYAELYKVCRSAGRVAFPLFVFLLAEGILHSRNVYKYVLRMAVLLLLSELPYDLAHVGWSAFNWDRQNVFLTLVLGMIPMAFFREYKGIQKLSFTAILTFGCAFLDEFVINGDYGMAGVVMIVVTGVLLSYLKEVPFGRVAALAAGMAAMLMIEFSFLELWGLVSLVFVALYNGRRGFNSPVVKYGFYLFYPMHLSVIAVLTHIVF